MIILEKNLLKQEKTQNTVFCYFKVNEICYHAAPLLLSVPITQYDLVGVIILLQVQIIVFLQVQMHVVYLNTFHFYIQKTILIKSQVFLSSFVVITTIKVDYFHMKTWKSHILARSRKCNT